MVSFRWIPAWLARRSMFLVSITVEYVCNVVSSCSIAMFNLFEFFAICTLRSQLSYQDVGVRDYRFRDLADDRWCATLHPGKCTDAACARDSAWLASYYIYREVSPSLYASACLCTNRC